MTIGGSTLSAGTTLSANATGDVVVESSTLGVAAGGSITLGGAQNVTLGSTTATGGALTLTATNGALLASGSTLGNCDVAALLADGDRQHDPVASWRRRSRRPARSPSPRPAAGSRPARRR